MEALNTKDISTAQALAVVAAALEKAKAIKTKMDIAVVDAGCNLKAFARMDDAWQGSIDIAIKKARTARYFDMNTGDIGRLSQPGGPLYNIEVSNGGLITFPGGIPLKASDGTVWTTPTADRIACPARGRRAASTPSGIATAIAAASDNHLAETATATLGREIDHTLGQNSEEVLAQIDAALKRIDDGTYGVCAGCGREIVTERLEAYPWAALCIDCKREVERR